MSHIVLASDKTDGPDPYRAIAPQGRDLFSLFVQNHDHPDWKRSDNDSKDSPTGQCL